MQVGVQVAGFDPVQLVQLDVREFAGGAKLADFLLGDSELFRSLVEREGRHHREVLLDLLGELLGDERGEFDGIVWHGEVPIV